MQRTAKTDFAFWVKGHDFFSTGNISLSCSRYHWLCWFCSPPPTHVTQSNKYSRVSWVVVQSCSGKQRKPLRKTRQAEGKLSTIKFGLSAPYFLLMLTTYIFIKAKLNGHSNNFIYKVCRTRQEYQSACENCHSDVIRVILASTWDLTIWTEILHFKPKGKDLKNLVFTMPWGCNERRCWDALWVGSSVFEAWPLLGPKNQDLLASAGLFFWPFF